MKILDQSREVHDDTNDRDITIKYILPKIIKDYETTVPTTDKYDPLDLYAYSNYKSWKNVPIPVQVKRRPDRNINWDKVKPNDDLETIQTKRGSWVDVTAYEDLKKYGLLIIFYPVNRQVLIYNHKEMANANPHIVVPKEIISHSERNNRWYYEKNKPLMSFAVEAGRIFTYEELGIPA